MKIGETESAAALGIRSQMEFFVFFFNIRNMRTLESEMSHAENDVV